MFDSRIIVLGLAAFFISTNAVEGARHVSASDTHSIRLPRSAESFSINSLDTMFQQALRMRDGSDCCLVLYLNDYIVAYNELSRVFDFFGYVFSFARDDIVSKLDTLTELRAADLVLGQHNYQTLENMFAYEYTEAARHLETPGVSTNRWLHSALNFIIRLIREVRREDSHGDLTSRVRTVYEDTLAPTHHWLVRAAARLALYSFPSRDQFMRAVNLRSDAAGAEALSRLETTLTEVYDHVQALYVTYD